MASRSLRENVVRYTMLVVLAAFLVTSCSSGPRRHLSAVEHGWTIDSYAQLYQGEARSEQEIAILAGYAGHVNSGRRVRVSGVRDLESGDEWEVGTMDIVELIPGHYEVTMGPPFRSTNWTAKFFAQAGTVYGFAYEELVGDYPKTMPLPLGHVSVAQVRARASTTEVTALLPKLGPEDGSRYAYVRTDTPLVQTSQRFINVVSWERFDVGHTSRAEAERLLGPPSRQETDATGQQVFEYDGIAYSTEREGVSSVEEQERRVLRLRYAGGGTLMDILEPVED